MFNPNTYMTNFHQPDLGKSWYILKVTKPHSRKMERMMIAQFSIEY